jgi:ABC-2 type transport system ATP-binding protein
MKVQVKNLRKEFGKTVAVDNISFSFDSGHVFGFVGPNGAGKTTTMRIISTIEEPTSGDVMLNGISICEEPELARRVVGYVPDTLPAHADITVHEYLDFYARAYGLRGKKRTQAVEAIEEFTNVIGIREKHLKALSKGMKQRVSLGRARASARFNVHSAEDARATGDAPKNRAVKRNKFRAPGKWAELVIFMRCGYG